MAIFGYKSVELNFNEKLVVFRSQFIQLSRTLKGESKINDHKNSQLFKVKLTANEISVLSQNLSKLIRPTDVSERHHRRPAPFQIQIKPIRRLLIRVRSLNTTGSVQKMVESRRLSAFFPRL